MRNDANTFLIDLIEVLLQLTIHNLRRYPCGFHDVYQSLLIAQQLRMDIHKLHLFYLWHLSEDIILPDILHPRALISRTQIEHRFAYQQLLGEGIIDPFLLDFSITSIYCCLMVLLGEWISESF